MHLALTTAPIHSIHQAKQTLHDHHQSWAEDRSESLTYHQELLQDPWVLNASAGQHMDLMHPTDFGHHAIAMIPDSPFEIGVTVGSLGLGTAGPLARETARFFKMTEQGVRTALRESVPLLRSAEQTTRRALTTARHTASKARGSAQVYLEYDLPNALERAFAPGGYTKAERELLQYGEMFEPSRRDFWRSTSRDFLVHPTRTTHLTRASHGPHVALAPSYTVPSDAVLSGESPFLFSDLPISTRPTQVPLWDVRSSGSNASNYLTSVFQETSYTRPAAPVLKQASLFAQEPSYVVQELVLTPFGLSYQGGRYSSGTVHITSPLADPQKLLRGSQRNAGFIPAEIATMMEGKTFKNFDRFREEFWRSMANSKYANEFGDSNLSRMKEGLAPFAQKSQRIESKKTYQLHHETPIYQGGSTYDLSNIIIVTPRYHLDTLERNLHYGRR